MCNFKRHYLFLSLRACLLLLGQHHLPLCCDLNALPQRLLQFFNALLLLTEGVLHRENGCLTSKMMINPAFNRRQEQESKNVSVYINQWKIPQWLRFCTSAAATWTCVAQCQNWPFIHNYLERPQSQYNSWLNKQAQLPKGFMHNEECTPPHKTLLNCHYYYLNLWEGRKLTW